MMALVLFGTVGLVDGRDGMKALHRVAATTSDYIGRRCGGGGGGAMMVEEGG